MSKEGFKRILVVDRIRWRLFLSFLKQMEMPFCFINGPSSFPCVFLSDPGGSSAQVWDATSSDPKLLVFLKSYRNIVPVPRHWCQKRKFLQACGCENLRARTCGLTIEGPNFRNKRPDELKAIVPHIQVMARSLPLDKHKLVTNLRSMHKEVVAVTGDGTNDAPALHEADIGLAMGIAGTKVAKENADVIILDDNFSTIVDVAKWGRVVYINIQKFVQFQLTVNIVALMINFISACISGSAPLTAVQLLWVNLIMEAILGLNGSDATIILNTFIFNTFVGDAKV
ncbi:hypothetical protein POM88_046283 [Heracleum sosnowskyi]|uniref:DUF382 domain-containing protein n=1 Tax=Heracleum sosnowskyi TaxID=360622 RepID=A0AAD8H7D5_9APIA|nr:hypothetical protein POM88_046283 [Heracleum sosnowskyi]